jgi:hypothetical protein
VQGHGTDTGVFATGSASGVTAFSEGQAMYASSITGDAAWLQGHVQVVGKLDKLSGSFLIDHPLDPANRYLQHSFVESPDMLNVYSGSVLLDAKGRATVRLPSYYHALNYDHRVQLTPVGAPAPNLHVAQEVADFRFRIAGGSAGQKVFWQVTGIRQDAWAQKNRIKVDYLKPRKQRGKYLTPELFGSKRSAGINFREQPKAPAIPHGDGSPRPPVIPAKPRRPPTASPR